MIRKKDRLKQKRQYDLLFVYGTLRRGCHHPVARRMRRYARYVSLGKVRGCLYQTADGYPALRLRCRRLGYVVGEVYKVLDAKRLFRMLDAYELCCLGDRRKEEYERCRIVVATGKKRVDAWAYVSRRDVRGLVRLGDNYAAYRKRMVR